MKIIGSLAGTIRSKSDEMTKRIVAAEEEFCEDLAKEIRSNIEIPPQSEALNPSQFAAYRNSIKVSITLQEKNVYRKEIYSDYYVFWKKKNMMIPVGVFLEWGTGPLGEESNIYEHGYPYTTEAPWNRHAMNQFITTGTWGIQARPHWWPAIMKYKDRFVEEILERSKI